MPRSGIGLDELLGPIAAGPTVLKPRDQKTATEDEANAHKHCCKLAVMCDSRSELENECTRTERVRYRLNPKKQKQHRAKENAALPHW